MDNNDALLTNRGGGSARAPTHAMDSILDHPVNEGKGAIVRSAGTLYRNKKGRESLIEDDIIPFNYSVPYYSATFSHIELSSTNQSRPALRLRLKQRLRSPPVSDRQ